MAALVVAALVAPGPAQAARRGRSAPAEQRIYHNALRGLGIEEATLATLERLLLAELGNAPGTRLIPAADLPPAQRRKVEGLARLCTGADSCLALIGKAAGAELVLDGTVGKLGEYYAVNVKVVATSRRAQLREVQTTLAARSLDEGDALLIPAIQELALRLVAPEQVTGALQVETSAQGAQIYLDGRLVGTTPLAAPLVGLAAGRHSLSVRKAGFAAFHRFIDVQFRQTHLLRVELTDEAVVGELTGEEAVARDNRPVEGIAVQLLPASPILPNDQAVRVTISFPELQRPPADLRVELAAAPGAIRALRRVDPLTFTAEYIPDRARGAAMAALIVAAFYDGAWRHRAVALPIRVSRAVRVPAPADSLVKLRIGTRELGPLGPERDGKARFEVVLSPADRDGVATITRAGRSSEQRLLLQEAIGTGVAVHATPTQVTADGSTPVRLVLAGYDEAGQLLAPERLRLDISRGQVEPLMVIPSGYLRGQAWPPPAVGDGAFALSARLAPDGPVTAVPLAVSPGPPAAVTVACDADTFTAGAGTRLQCEAAVADAGGNPTDSQELTGSAELGNVVAPLRVDKGRYRVVWQLPDHFAGAQRARLQLAVPGGGARGDIGVRLRAGALRQLQPSLALAASANGHEPAQVEVRAEDGYGNGVSGLTLATTVDVGAITQVRDRGDGSYLLHWLPPLAGDGLSGTLRLDASGVQAELTARFPPPRWVWVLALSSANTLQLEQRLFVPGAAVELGWRPPWLAGLYLAGGLGYGYLADGLALDVVGLGSVALRLHNLSLVAIAAWEVDLGERVALRAGLRGGVLYSYAQLSAAAIGQVGQGSLAPVADGLLAGLFRIGQGDVALELGYRYARLGAAEVRGPVGGLLVALGYALAF